MAAGFPRITVRAEQRKVISFQRAHRATGVLAGTPTTIGTYEPAGSLAKIIPFAVDRQANVIPIHVVKNSFIEA